MTNDTNLGLIGRYIGGDDFTHSLSNVAPHLVVGQDAVDEDINALAGVEDDRNVEADCGRCYGSRDPGDS